MKKKNFVFKFISKHSESLGRNFFYRYYAPVVFKNKPLKEKLDINNVKTILVLRTDFIGDLICTTPLFRVIKKMNPNVRLIVAASDNNGFLIEHDTNIDDKLILKRKGKYDADVIRYLKKQNIDVLFNTVKMNTTKEGLLLNRVSPKGIKVSFYHNERPYYKSLYNLLLNIGDHVPENMHISLMSIELLKGTFINPIKEEWIEQYLIVPEPARNKWSNFREEKKIEKKKFIIINLTVRQPRNWWTKEGYEFLIKNFLEKHPDYKVLLSAVGTKDIAYARKLTETFPRTYHYNTDTVLESAAMCEDALLTVTPDTGFLHVASAMKCPVVELFLEKEKRWYPFKVPAALVVLKGDYIKDIEPQRVVDATEKLIDQLVANQP